MTRVLAGIFALLLAGACSASPRPLPAPSAKATEPTSLRARAPRAHRSGVTGRGGDRVVAEQDRISRLGADGHAVWTVRVRLFPSVEPSFEPSAERKVAVGAGNTVLTGAYDGSLLALDAAGSPLWQLGVRGGVSGIEALPDGGFVVRTGAGLETVVSPRGAVRGEPPAAAPSLPLSVGPVDSSYRLERVVLDVEGGPPFRSALSLAAGPRGVLWLHDGARVVEHDGVRTRVIYEAPKPEPFVCWPDPQPDCEVCVSCNPRKREPIGCRRCVATTAAGEGAVLAEPGLLRIRGGRAEDDAADLSGLSGVAAAPSGAFWAVSSRTGDGLSHAVIQDLRGLRFVSGLPHAGYADVTAFADDDVWLAGGLGSAEEGGRVWPVGEGTLVHFDGRGFERHRGPDGPLLAVAAVGPAEAWAVGAGGGVLHAKAGAAKAYHLALDRGARLPIILRAVAAARPDDVWMAGDGSTLLRWDGRVLHRLDASAAGSRAALSALIAPGASPGWVAGPSGIWRLVKLG